MEPIKRRDFFRNSAAYAAALASLQAARPAPAAEDDPPATKSSANDALNVAVVGVHGRGLEHIGGFGKLKDANIVAVCDVDENIIGPAQTMISLKQGKPAKYYQDIRKLLDDKSIDAISIATPNHWHALAAIWACQSGKDVYVEKPVSHNVVEGRRIVEAARKYNKIVQTGTQCRSHQGIKDAMKFLHEGGLGKVYLARGLCYKPRGSIGHKADAAVPKGVDYNLWLGPAPERPFNPNRFHYEWHWNWDYGNGDLGNQGIHQMDLARWGLNKNEFPKSVQASGGRFGYSDDGQTPNTLSTAFEFDDCMLEFEVRGLPTNSESGVKVGDLFYGPEGFLAITSYTDWQSFLGPKLEKGPGGRGGGDHFGNFVKAVKRETPSCSRPTSPKATSRARTATWAISPTGWAGSSKSSLKARRSRATPRQARCSRGNIARVSLFQTKFEVYDMRK